MRFLDEEGGRRFIYKDRSLFEHHLREPFLPQDDDQDGYYVFDDDYIRSAYGTVAHNVLRCKHCRRTSDHRLNYQTCSIFHETPFLECQVKPLGYVIDRVNAIDHQYNASHTISPLSPHLFVRIHLYSRGAFRQVFGLWRSFGQDVEEIAIKHIKYEYVRCVKPAFFHWMIYLAHTIFIN
jgi:hypothetical protein